MTELARPPSVSTPDPAPFSSARWRRLALSVAAVGSAAAGSAAMGAVVQITQAGNEITSAADNLRSDLTGDGASDLPGLLGSAGSFAVTSTFSNTWRYGNFVSVHLAHPGSGNFKFLGSARYFIRGSGVIPFANTTRSGYSQYAGSHSATAPLTASGMVPITFSDVLVNGGAATSALLEIRAFSSSKTSHTVRLLRLVFNDRSTAAPTGAGTTAGAPAPEFNRAAAAAAARNAAIAALKKKIAAAIETFRKAKQKKQTSKALHVKRRIRSLKARLADIQDFPIGS